MSYGHANGVCVLGADFNTATATTLNTCYLQVCGIHYSFGPTYDVW